MNVLTFPLPLFRRCLADLITKRIQIAVNPVGTSRWSGNFEFIVASAGSATGLALAVELVSRFGLSRDIPGDYTAILQIGQDEQLGRASGYISAGSGSEFEPIHLLRLVGPGMHSLSLAPSGDEIPADTADNGQPLLERWSRTVGALGGEEIWQRLVHLRYGIIGAGRSGSGVAQALARVGVKRLVIIDPDKIEMANLGEAMAFLTEADIGRFKVDAVADSLKLSGHRYLEIKTVPASITRLQSLQAVQACDLLVVCCDHDSARLAATAIAVLFAKPLLDIATGVLGLGDQRLMGADVRLVLPGNCLHCFGGLHNEAQARQVLASADAEEAFYANRVWHQERTGSLSSLNESAIGFGLRLIEDLVAERVRQSTWIHLEFDPEGRPRITYPRPAPASGQDTCEVCKLGGMGEIGLSRVPELLKPQERRR